MRERIGNFIHSSASAVFVTLKTMSGLAAKSGLTVAVLGTILLSTKSIFIKLAYEHGGNPETTLLLRMLLATAFFWAIHRYWSAKRPTGNKHVSMRGSFATVLVAGLMGFSVSPLLDFYGLDFISASLERVLLFSYPVFVVVLAAVMRRRMIAAPKVITLIMIEIGIFLAMGGWEFSRLKANLFGSVLIILSAATYAGYFLLAERVLPKVGSIRMNAYGATIASAVLLGHEAFREGPEFLAGLSSYHADLYLIIFLLTVLSTVAPLLLLSEGIRSIGAERVAIVGAFGPVITILLAVVGLQESLTWVQVIGCFVIVLAVLLMEGKLKRRASERPEGTVKL